VRAKGPNDADARGGAIAMRRPAQILSTLLFLFFAGGVQAQQIIQTYAGGGPGAVQPYGLAADAAGNTYMGDYATHRVYKVTPSGQIIVVAGNGVQGYNGDNIPATNASLNYPPGVAVDSVGNVFIADYYNHRVRRVDASTGIITTVAGTGTAGFNGDNIAAASANLYYPVSVAVDTAGNLYITDQYNHRIRFVNVSTGFITTVAGNGCAGYNGDNISATAACLYYPYDAKVDIDGNLYIADASNSRIRKVFSSGPNAGKIFTVAGNGGFSFYGDGGPATSAYLYYPIGVELDAAGNLYIADYYNQRVRVVNAAGTISTLAGNGSYCSSVSSACGDGSNAASAGLYYPVRVAAGGSGNLFIAEPWSSPGRLRQVSLSSGIISTTVGGGGGGVSPGDGLLATSAGLYYPIKANADSAGNVFIVEYYGHRVRRVDAATKIITTVAGNGCAGYNGDNIPATSACLYYPRDVAVDGGGNVFIGDFSNSRIRRVDASTGKITTAAGGCSGYNGDGILATSACLSPLGVAVDVSGNLYIADYANQRIRRVDASGPNAGKISTVVGNGCYGYNGDGILATSACLYYPYDVALDGSGNIYIADTSNNRIRRVDASGPNAGKISTVAGSGCAGYNGDGILATSACLYDPVDVAVDGAGNLFIADLINQRIRRVDATSGKISTFAGTGTAGFGGDGGSPTGASFYYPYGASVDGIGNLYIADFYNQRVRSVRVDATPPTITETITGTLGNADWYVSDVTVSWSVVDPDSAISSQTGCGTSSVTTDTAGTTFTCAATSAGGTSSRSVTIRRDTIPPVLVLPANMTVQATSTSGTAMTFAATANDALTGAQMPVCAPASGSTFPLGTTTVNCTASDPAGNSSAGSFTVRVNAPVCTAPPSGLVSWWRAEGNASDTIDSNNGTLQGGTTFAPGKVGQAFNFDGTSGQVRISNPPNLRMTAALTIETWIYPTGPGSSGPGGGGGILVNKEGEYEVARWYDGSIQWAIANTSPGWYWINTGYFAPQGQWTHIVITYDGTAIRTYANGALVHSYPGSGTIGDIAPGSDDVLIGGRGASQFFQGEIDEVGIYNRALSATEISSVFNAAYAGKCVPPPTANAGPNRTVEATSAAGASVTLNGSGSRDPDGDTLTYTWTGPFGTASGVNPTVVMPLGTNSVSLNVYDGHGDTATATVQITVQDTTPPVLTLPGNINVQATSASGAAVTFAATANDLVSGVLPVTCIPASGSAFAITTTTVNCSATDAAGNTATGSFTVTVTKISQTITFAALPNRTYGNADFGVTATASSGLTVSFTVGATDNCTISAGTVHIIGAGSCTVAAHQAGDSTYTVAPDVPQTFTISKATASVTPNAASKTYGTADSALTGTLSGFVAVDNVTATYSRTSGETVAGGPYSISAILAPAAVLGNYNVTYNTASFTINRANASVTPAAAGKTYGTAEPTLSGTLTGFLPAEGVTAIYTRTAGETAGLYNISATLSPAGVLGNYSITYNTAAFTISKANASVTPNAASKIYGAPEPAFTGSLTGFLAADNVTATYARTAGETVGGSPYGVSATLSPTAVLGNYNIAYNTANFSITPKGASVTPNAASKTYGAMDPALSGALSGFLAADNVTATYSRTAGETVLGSPYTISATLSPAGVLGNYNITYGTASFTISKAAATVTPAAASKTYGAADPALTGTLSGFVPSDGVTATYTRTAGETVAGSPYTISGTLNPASVLVNYNVTYSTASFTITKAALTVTANSTSKILDAANPALNNVTYSTFMFSDGPGSLGGTLSCTTIAGTTSPVGNYTITCSGQTSSNYAITYVAGTLKVLYAPAGGVCYGDVSKTILQPVNADGTSVWKLGRTVPVKFRVCDANGVSIGTPGVVSSFLLTGIWNGTIDPVDETVSATNSDTAFRWDSTALQWIFNLSTNSLSANKTYIYTITLNDGTIVTGTTLAGAGNASFQYGLR